MKRIEAIGWAIGLFVGLAVITTGIVSLVESVALL